MIARLTALTVISLTLLVGVATAALPGGAVYVGKADGGGAVKLRLNSDGKRVKRMRIHYTVECDNGRTGDTYTDILNIRIRSDNTFSARGMYTGSGDGSENTFRVAGKVSARRASGTFSLKATGDDPDTGEAISCKTGQLDWHAKRR